MKIAVIPARGGSKRIPHKNIKEFCGKPMIAWSIETAKISELFDHIIVSTDDHEISKIAKEWGAEVPFIRPAELSNDYAGITEVIAHTTEWALRQGWPVTTVCCIFATAPFIQVQDLKLGLEALESDNWAYAFTATNFSAPILRSFKQTSAGGVEMFFPEHFLTRSQDLQRALHDAGQFYWGRSSSWIEGKRIFDIHSIPIILPQWRVQDIDNEEDWLQAEIIASIIVNNKPEMAGNKITSISSNSQQEKFWAGTFGDNYINRNHQFDYQLASEAWTRMLQATQGKVSNYLECGSNIGRNVSIIKRILPNAKPSIIEINETAFNIVTSQHSLVHAFNGSIMDSNFDYDSFDLVFTMDVLIHIHPDALLDHMKKIFCYSSKFILIGEYFNRTPISINYRGEREVLFKRDFGKFFIENFNVTLLDYGFLWGHIYDSAGFNDITWWLFEKHK